MFSRIGSVFLNLFSHPASEPWDRETLTGRLTMDSVGEFKRNQSSLEDRQNDAWLASAFSPVL